MEPCKKKSHLFKTCKICALVALIGISTSLLVFRSCKKDATEDLSNTPPAPNTETLVPLPESYVPDASLKTSFLKTSYTSSIYPKHAAWNNSNYEPFGTGEASRQPSSFWTTIAPSASNEWKSDFIGVLYSSWSENSAYSMLRHPSDYRPWNWMKNLSGNIRLIDMSIPGSHDAGTAGVSGTGSSFAQCQSLPLCTQLYGGIRYLDIRLRVYNGSLLVHHGSYYANINFNDVLKEVQSFLDRFPSEFVILSIQQEYSTDDSMIFLGLVAKYLSSYPSSKFYKGHRWGNSTEATDFVQPSNPSVDHNLTSSQFAIPLNSLRINQLRGKILLVTRIPYGKTGYNIPCLAFEAMGSESTSGLIYGARPVIVQDATTLSPSSRFSGKSSLFNKLIGEAFSMDKLGINGTNGRYTGWDSYKTPSNYESDAKNYLYDFLNNNRRVLGARMPGIIQMDLSNKDAKEIQNTLMIIERNYSALNN